MMQQLMAMLEEQLRELVRLEKEIRENLRRLGYE